MRERRRHSSYVGTLREVKESQKKTPWRASQARDQQGSNLAIASPSDSFA